MSITPDSLTNNLSDNSINNFGGPVIKPDAITEAEWVFADRLLLSSGTDSMSPGSAEPFGAVGPEETNKSDAVLRYNSAYMEFVGTGMQLNSSQFRALMELLSLSQVASKTGENVITGLLALQGSQNFEKLRTEYNNLDSKPNGGQYQISRFQNTLKVTSPFGENSFRIDSAKSSRVSAQIGSVPKAADMSAWNKETVEVMNAFAAFGTAAVLRTSP